MADTQATELQIRENVLNKIQTYLRKSEGSGCTYDKYSYNQYIEDVVKEEIKTHAGDIPKNKQKEIRAQVYNKVYDDLENEYLNSLTKHPREVNNLGIPKKYNETTAGRNQATLRIAKQNIYDSTIQLLRDSVEEYATPSREEFITKVKSDILKMCDGMDDEERDYVLSYLTYWAEHSAPLLYDESLQNDPRSVNHKFPKGEQKEVTTKFDKDREKRIKKQYHPLPLSEYKKAYNTFSGIDMVCTVSMPLPDGSFATQTIGELQTITYSIHEEKTPIRCLGDMNVKGYVFGPRTVAGSMIFNVFDRHWAKSLMQQYMDSRNYFPHYMVDELPPLDITISFANEYGTKSRLALYGIVFVNEGQVMSINDMYMENTFQFYATDVEYLTPVKNPPSEDKDETHILDKLPVLESNIKYLNDVSEKSDDKKARKKEMEKAQSVEKIQENVTIAGNEYEGFSYEEYKNTILKSARKTEEELTEERKKNHLLEEDYQRLIKKNYENFEKKILAAQQYYSCSGVVFD